MFDSEKAFFTSNFPSFSSVFSLFSNSKLSVFCNSMLTSFSLKLMDFSIVSLLSSKIIPELGTVSSCLESAYEEVGESTDLNSS